MPLTAIYHRPMHQHPYNNIPQLGKKGCHDQNESPPSISTDLSLMISSTFQNQQGGAAASRSIRGTPHYDGKKNHNCCSSYWGYSTSLELYDNPWKIKKALTASDLGKLNRLLFGSDMLEKLMVPVLGEDAQRDAETGMGTPVRVWDVDTCPCITLFLSVGLLSETMS
ncbi:B3 domain-containing protein [Sesbania bispinosa]|nr:B3 domain-containing protein [Sesbania bispinosa]